MSKANIFLLVIFFCGAMQAERCTINGFFQCMDGNKGRVMGEGGSEILAKSSAQDRARQRCKVRGGLSHISYDRVSRGC